MTILQNLSGAALRHLPRGRVLALRTSYLGLRERLAPLLKTMHGGFTTDDLRAHLEFRVGRFDVLMVHSSLNFMHPYFEGSPAELLDMLVQYVGPNRTLVMPAFYLGDPELNNAVEHYRRTPQFDVRRTPSQMGILTELFRRRAGVKVSLHPTHRTAALGPLAEAITAGHFDAGTTFGQGTPFDVMAAHDTAIVGMGKSYEVLTQVHHAEDLLGDEFPITRRVNPVEVTVIDNTKTSRAYSLRTPIFDRPRRMPKLRELMSQPRLQEWNFHNVPMFHTRAAWVTEDLLAAALRGQTIYEPAELQVGRVPRIKRRQNTEGRTVKLLETLTTTAKKAGAVIDMRRLDTAPRRHLLTPAESLHSTLKWLMRAQDGTPDDGVSYGFSLNTGWTVSYPETTGYILQTFLKYHDIFGDADVLSRARRMARWEVDIQLPNGATPGSFGTTRAVPVAFNTGQVLLGWAEYLRRFPEDAFVRDAAIKAGRWLISCMGDKPWFEGGVSAKAEHGNLSYNSMVSWGLAELGEAVGDPVFTNAGHISATHYASQIDERRWPCKAGFSDADCVFPLTHTLGYTIQGFIETGRLTGDMKLVETAREILDASCQVIDAETGFLPGRVQAGWQGGAPWVCLTGSAQFACCFLQLHQMGRGRPQYGGLAEKLVANVVSTQFSQEDARPEIAGGVRGSFPFSTKGYEPIALPNWAAKFLIDAELLLQVQGRL